jgi:hypothetical protein
VAERVDDPAESPAVLVDHAGRFSRAGSDRLPDDAVGVFDYEQRSASRATNLARAEPLHRRGRRSHPERCVADAELRDDVVPAADLVKDGCAECGFVERNRFTGIVDPQLRLNTRQRAASRLGTTLSREPSVLAHRLFGEDEPMCPGTSASCPDSSDGRR